MLTLVVKLTDEWDEKSERFVGEELELHLEHSLVSLSKWESKFEKPFLGDGEKTTEEVLDYIRFMILDPNFPPEAFAKLTDENMDDVNTYINAKKSATWFRDAPRRSSQEVITSELIYYWMIAFDIPFECQHWHLNRLFTLIKVCDVKSQKPKTTSKSEMLSERDRLNKERRAKYNTSG